MKHFNRENRKVNGKDPGTLILIPQAIGSGLVHSTAKRRPIEYRAPFDCGYGSKIEQVSLSVLTHIKSWNEV